MKRLDEAADRDQTALMRSTCGARLSDRDLMSTGRTRDVKTFT